MRNSILILLTCFTTLSAVAQKGISFVQAPIASVFKTAQAARKPVFVEIYSPSCHVCQSFMPTLADSRVGKSYNSKFINTRLDVDQPATRAFLQSKKYYIPSLPLFLYFSPEGELIHFAMSQNSTDEVIRHGNNATTPAARSANWKQRYAAGDKSPNFLIDLGMYSRVTGDTVTNMAAMDDYAKQQPANTHSNNTNWLVLQKIILDMDNPLARSLVSNIGIFKQQYGQTAVNVAENILMSSLYSSRGLKFSPAQIKQVYEGLVRIGIDPNLAGSRTLLPEVNAYFKLKQGQRAAERMDSHVATHSLVPAEYLYVAKLFNRSSPDPSDVPYLTKWINKALSLKTTPGEQADLYYEQADAFRRAGRTADARKAANRALELAQAGHIDTKRNVKQISELK
ncbi:thioredoxin family protein [Fibrella sp. HMF5335]|uniref:Thioredoxin family protein n=1 Tax=Fibrella rubiginis TaxID=2817060 RepID=A0A939GC31_9BACT|nr:thioredoxin family protein [Fibrella rubiginis]MBO0936169.1 thioredoxin family protein [Fibrella rubiginis]